MADASNAEPFTKMAQRIEHNSDAKFGGAVVIVPPVGEQIELLMLDEAADAAQFWGTLKTRIQFALDKLEEQQRTAQGFGRR